jgi:S-DNA-T family DNA segregation ATPase FtsK/SpoIIIE
MVCLESRMEVVRTAPRILTTNEYRRRVEYVLNLTRPHPEGRKWRCVDVKKTRYMIQLTYEIPARYSALDVQKQLDALVATCGSDIEIVNYAGRVGIRIYPEDLPDKIDVDHALIEKMKGMDVLLGYDRNRTPIIHTFKHPHMIIAGEPGFGKTELLFFIIYQWIKRLTRNDLEIHVIDLKGTSFIPFIGIPHLHPIATDLDKAYETVKRVYDIMIDRRDKVLERGDKQLLRQLARKKHLLVIDEAGVIAPKLWSGDERKTCQMIDGYLSQLLMVGRELGIHVFYCLQYPHSDYVNPQIRACAGGRLSFHLSKQEFSEVVIGEPGAEKLSTPGRAIYKTDKAITIQVPYMHDLEKRLEAMEGDARRTLRNGATRAQDHADHEYGTDSAFLSLRPLSVKKSE